ncbi:MAG: sigma-70 family RNA polymerase sigma factor [Planctomycetota bacterium]
MPDDPKIESQVPLADPEGDLVQRLRDREPGAVEDVLRMYGGRLLAVARRIVKDEHLAQDTVQDGFIMAMNGFDKFDGRSQLGTWLYRIVVNAALMKLRKKSFKERPAGEAMPQFLDSGNREFGRSTWREAPEAMAESHEMQDLVLASIAELPDDYRTILLLRDIEELNTKEAATVLGISPGAAKVRLHRARQALREVLDPIMSAGAETSDEEDSSG